MTDSNIINILIVFGLIVLNSYFVVLEFALVQIRASRIDTLISEGNKRAVKCKKVKDGLNTYLSATQLGITVVGLLLGWMGEPTVSRILEPLLDIISLSDKLSRTISIIVSFSIITALEVVLGELVPKALALLKAEEFNLALDGSLIVFHKITYPIIWTFDRLTDLCLKPFGLSQLEEVNDKYTKGELEMLVDSSLEEDDGRSLLSKAFKFGNVVAEDIMIHRLDMVCISKDSEQEEVLRIITENGYTRYPVTSDDKDHIVGYVHVRDIYRDVVADNLLNLSECIREVNVYPEGMELTSIFMELKKNREQIAIIVDEQGGTSGLLTMEDIMEELVGDISDEFDSLTV